MTQNPSIDQLLAFTWYLSWADLQGAIFDEEMNREPDANDPEAVKEHEWRWFGLMSYWYASLNVVIEAWEELKFHDPVLDQLLAATNMRHLLQRYRNAVLHFQCPITTPKFKELLQEGEAHVFWTQALHQEFVRFLFEYLSGLVVTAEQRTEFRTMIESILHWYPYRHHRTVDTSERTARAREMLSQCPNDGSEARRELERSVDEAGSLLTQASYDRLDEFRTEILRKAGY